MEGVIRVSLFSFFSWFLAKKGCKITLFIGFYQVFLIPSRHIRLQRKIFIKSSLNRLHSSRFLIFWEDETWTNISNQIHSIMSVKAKYQPVLDLGEKLEVQNGDVYEENGTLKMKGTVKTQYEKDILWDKIKEIGGEKPADLLANIVVDDTSVYHRHEVQSGESLSKIAKHYYGDPMKYQAIFEANRNLLDNPDLIHPGQVLVIPNL